MSESEPKKIIFVRKNWTRGTLAEGDGSFCALGFYLNQAVGIPESLLRGIGSPTSVPFRMVAEQLNSITHPTPEVLEKFAQKLVDAGAQWLVCPVRNFDGTVTGFRESERASKIVGVNDSVKFDRERILTDLFASHGVQVEFV